MYSVTFGLVSSLSSKDAEGMCPYLSVCYVVPIASLPHYQFRSHYFQEALSQKSLTIWAQKTFFLYNI